MHKILFICHGNICRSPMAEFLLKNIVKKRGIAADFEIASAATSREEIAYIMVRVTSWRSLASASQASMQYR